MTTIFAAIVVPNAGPRTAPRSATRTSALHLSEVPKALDYATLRTTECLVDAENAVEQAECIGTPVRAPAARRGGIDDCIADAEKAAEIAACSDPSIGLSLKECIVDAENAAEQTECIGAPAPAPASKGAARAGFTEEEFKECIVNAENAAEITDCKS